MDLAYVSPEEIALPPSPPEFADAITNVHQETQKASILQPRPETPRRSTEPRSLDDAGTSTLNFTVSLPSRPRNHSPYSRTHYRSRSSASSSTGMAPPMARAHSSPGMDSSGRMLIPNNFRRPSSPLGPPQGRRRSPLRSAMEEPYPAYNYASGGLNISQPIAEYSELDITPRASVIPEDSEAPSSPLLLPAFNNTFPRSRRRPSSPLHQVASAPPFASPTANTASPISSQSSPLIGSSTKFNEPYPSSNTFPYSYSFSSSSMPSTPTSMRSRSPSISSLETIPDDTDAEEAALVFEAERIAALKAAAEEGEEAVKDEPRRRTSLDVPGRPGNSKRKRWSVCGAERRGDLDLETIWED